MKRFHPPVTRSLAFLVLPLACGAFPSAARASIVYYSTQSAFDVAAPGLSLATFSGTTGAVATGPLANTVPGITLNTVAGGSQNLVYESGGIAPNYFGDTLILDFSPDVSAVGLYLKGQYSGSNVSPAPLISDIYTQGSSNPTETDPTIAGNTTYFFGVTSTTPITSLRFLFDYQEFDAWTIASNVEFGSVPEPSSLALLMAGSVFLLQRRTRRNRA